MYCLDCRYVERQLYQYCEMDTDSAYIALAGESIDDLVTSEHREHYFKHRSEWLPAECCDNHKDDYVHTRLAGRTWTATEPCCLARKAFDKRTPGLFKIEWCGDGFIGLCSKTYYSFGSTDKCTTKGLNKRQNTIDKDAFLSVLTNRRSGGGLNRGFRVHNSSMMTYIQERAALTYFFIQNVKFWRTASPRHHWIYNLLVFLPLKLLLLHIVSVCCYLYHGPSLATPLHVHRRRTDGLR